MLFDGEKHSALDDARATAKLLAVLLRESADLLEKLDGQIPLQLPQIPKSNVQPLCRTRSRQRQKEVPSYLQRIMSRVESTVCSEADDGVELAYAALLDRILEDRKIEEAEGQSLIEFAENLGLSYVRVMKIHSAYLLHLCAAALSDGIVTNAEHRDLSLVSRLLGIGVEDLDSMLAKAKSRLESVKSHADDLSRDSLDGSLDGKSICFTGECICHYRGESISREFATELAKKAGLTVLNSVTKKLDILVVADPHTQSGKARKAKEYGVRILYEPVFWKAIGVQTD